MAIDSVAGANRGGVDTSATGARQGIGYSGKGMAGSGVVSAVSSSLRHDPSRARWQMDAATENVMSSGGPGNTGSHPGSRAGTVANGRLQLRAGVTNWRPFPTAREAGSNAPVATACEFETRRVHQLSPGR